MRGVRAVEAVLSVALVVAPWSARAQGTLADYRRAAGVNQRLAGLTVDVAQTPTWTGPSKFWYRKSVKGGAEFVAVDAATGRKAPAFDHAKLASALSSATGSTFTAITLPFNEFSYADGGETAIDVDAAGSRWRCTIGQYQCTRTGAARAAVGGRGGAAAIRPGGVTGDAPTPSTACMPPADAPAAGRGGRGAGGRGGGGGRGAAPGGGAAPQIGCISPDGHSVAFVQNYNVA